MVRASLHRAAWAALGLTVLCLAYIVVVGAGSQGLDQPVRGVFPPADTGRGEGELLRQSWRQRHIEEDLPEWVDSDEQHAKYEMLRRALDRIEARERGELKRLLAPAR